MVVKAQVDALLNKKMDRQNFIKHVAVGVVAISGAGAALRLLGAQKPKAQSVGYGGSAYGGTKTGAKIG